MLSVAGWRIPRRGRARSANAWATSRCCSPAWSDRTAAGRKRPTSHAPPASTIWRGRSCGSGSARRSCPASPTSGEGRADVMRGEEVQLLGAVADGTVAAQLPRLSSRHAQQMGDGCRRANHSVPDGHDGRAVQLAPRTQHPVGPSAEGRRARRHFWRGRPARGWIPTVLVADLFSVRAGVLARQPPP